MTERSFNKPRSQELCKLVGDGDARVGQAIIREAFHERLRSDDANAGRKTWNGVHRGSSLEGLVTTTTTTRITKQRDVPSYVLPASRDDWVASKEFEELRARQIKAFFLELEL